MPLPSARKPFPADDQRHCNGIDPEDQRPFLSDDVEKAFDAVGIDCCKHGFMDRGDRARMATGKCDQVLVRFHRFAEPVAELGYRAFFKGDHGRHWKEEYARSS